MQDEMAATRSPMMREASRRDVLVTASAGGLLAMAAGPGAIAFGSVVILTMLASMQFDPRLIWDHVDGRTQKPQDSDHD